MTNALMIQGTTSDAGKSILVTAICRILARHKISVAPFKPQNMALNSAVTIEGGEIGRAQAVQAEACYLSPSILMNPILLKPNSDLGSQVIIHGKSIGNMKAQEYHRYKPQLLNTVIETYQQLQEKYQHIIIEGAGSPAEINLREHDIANMGFAEAINCPVIIVADIDRGGVFAHLYGTYELLSDSEKNRVQGFVINRFRGDVNLLNPGLEWLEEKTGIPTLAVIPYIHNLHIEAEDSLSQKQNGNQNTNADPLHIIIPTYPRTSNHTDFDVLKNHPSIDCQHIKNSSDFTGADIIVLPGSKNVRVDLQWLKDNGWESIIQRHLRLGGKIIGICGGYQMLGNWVHDPDAVESAAGSSQGLGLLEMETTLFEHKTLRNVTGFLHEQLSNSRQRDEKITVSGYEIHAGTSTGKATLCPLFTLYARKASGNSLTEEDTFPDGAQNNDNTVIGSYLHGLFDSPEFLQHIVSWAGGSHAEIFDYALFKEQEINRLADAVESVLPASLICDLLNTPVPSTKSTATSLTPSLTPSLSPVSNTKSSENSHAE
ncbi:MAG: adenosylcobyric acid synthase [Candidatus Endobugula sp.]|jgi:adenosylcobyric acid synthase